MADDATPAAPAATPAATDGVAAPPPSTAAPFDWSKAGLSQEHLNLVTERAWKTPGDVMTSYRHLETATGVPPDRLIKLPAPRDAGDPKVWEPIYKQLGRPEKADGYVIPLPEGDKGEFAAAVKPWMHEAGLSQSQATKLATRWNEHNAKTQQAQQSAMEQRNLTDISQLKQAWGGEFDTKAAIVDRAADTFGMTQEHLDGLKAALGPKAAMEFLYNIGSRIAVEDASVPGMTQGATTFTMSPEAAQAKIAQLKEDRSYAQLFNSKDPKQRMEARTEMDRLHKIAYPGFTPVSVPAKSTRA